MKNALICCVATLALSLSAGCCGPMWTAGCRTGTCDGGLCASPISIGHAACDGGCGACAGGCSACDGCGELYIDPWINHPADCCDPCDSCGNHNGMSCGKCRPVFSGIKSLWGYRCVDNCGGCDDCASGPFNTCGGGGCDGGCSECGHGEVIHGDVIHQGAIPMGALELPGTHGSHAGQSRTEPPRTLAIQRNSRSNPRPAKPIFQSRRE